MDAVPIMQTLILLTLANGSPVIAKKLFGETLARPLDGGSTLCDGQPLFGPSKTIRGIVVAIVSTAVGASVVGIAAMAGALVGAAAMAGDLFSSCIKRRLRLAPSSMALGLDQIPESLFPAFVAAPVLGLEGIDIAIIVVVFLIGELILSQALFRLGLRDRPY
jgi:CDP-archaeol synthase